MKNLDSISKRIAVASIGICGILLCVSVLLFSLGNVSKGYATETSSSIQKNSLAPAATGEIMMSPILYQDGAIGYIFWSTTTGKSAKYSWDQTLGAWKKEPDKYQLPAVPLQ